MKVKILKESVKRQTIELPKDRLPMFTFPNGDYVYIEMDNDNGKLYAGNATNNGLIKEYEIDYDYDDSLDGNLEHLYDMIIEERPELLDESLNEFIDDSDTTKRNIDKKFGKGASNYIDDFCNYIEDNYSEEDFNNIIDSKNKSGYKGGSVYTALMNNNEYVYKMFGDWYKQNKLGESIKESKTSYGDTTIEDYVNANFSGDADSKKKFVSAMKKKVNGKDYFNGLNMSVKDWEKAGKKFGLSMKRYPVTESNSSRENNSGKSYKKRGLTEAMEKPYFRAFITNLGKYNEGELVGDWVDFPIDEDEFEEKLAEIGIGSEDEFGNPYEEWFVTDYECNLDAFEWEELGEYPSYETLQEFGELVDSIDDVVAVNNAYEVTDDLREAIEGLDDGDIIFYPGLNSWEDLAYYIIDDVYGGVENLDPSVQEQFFDYEALGRDLGFDTYESEDEDGNEVQLSAGEYFCGDENATDYEIGEAFVDQVGFDGVGNPEYYFDYESYGRDFQYDNFTITSDGIIEYR